MKKEMTKPEIEFIEFDECSTITTSSGFGNAALPGEETKDPSQI